MLWLKRSKSKTNMTKTTFINIFKRRNFWRFANFSEVGELYAARLMRTIGINVGAAFMSVYMIQAGLSIVAVSIFWSAYFLLKTVLALPFAQLIAMIGSKKAILISNFLYIPAIVFFVTLPEYGLRALVATGFFQAVSAALYDIGYLINFSRIKNSDAFGRQVAFMNIMEKIAKAVSPLIGGLLAFFFDPRVSILVSAVFFILASWPMARTVDTMTKGFRLKVRQFPWHKTRASLAAQLPVGFDIYASGNAWSIFLACIIFSASSNQIYAELGALTSLIVFISLGATYAYGKLIDRRTGDKLMFWTAIGAILVNIIRAITKTPIMAVGVNTANEVTITGYSMAFTKGVFDVADNSGYRVMYMGLSQMISYAGSFVASLSLALAVALLDASAGFAAFYLLVAAVASSMLLVRFRVYQAA